MKQKYNFSEILEFYEQNDLDEVFSNNINDKFRIYNEKNLNEQITNIDQKTNILNQPIQEKLTELTINSNIKNISSTSQALAELAKKNQITSMENKSVNIDEKFLSINQIIENAKMLASKAKNIAELKEIVENFEGCNLKKMATNTVFADGNPNSKIMVIGEAPGNHEDLSGMPFCGDSGEMLTGMFNAINLTRDKDYYVTNVIFWRPPGNRRPTSEELAICRPFVEKHLQLFDPKTIILVGATAMSALINDSETISKIRGKFIDFSPQFINKKTKIFTIFHPSFLMRQPSKKKLTWLDMLNLQKFIKNNYEE